MVPAGKENLPPCSLQLVHILEFVPELGADDSRKDNHCDNVERVGVDTVANEVPVQRNCAADGGEPEQQPKGSNVSKTEIQIGIHAGFSIAMRRRGEHQ